MADETWNKVGDQARIGALAQAHSIGRVDFSVQYGDQRVSRTPRQLSAADPYFLDRDEEQVRADQALEAWPGREPAQPPVVVLSGIAGIGKSALAVQLAWRWQARFPDGMLHLDLGERRHEGAVALDDALATLLRQLGVPPDWVEPGFADRLGQYRSLTADKRMILVLDDVAAARELRPLLPASVRSVVLATTYAAPRALAGAGAIPLALGPLAEPHGLALLRQLITPDRADAEPEALAELARRCAGLPLALRVVGDLLTDRELWSVQRSVAEFDQEGLPVVEAVWDAAYQSLRGEAARLYRLLPEHPAVSFAEPVAAALLGRDERTAQDALGALLARGLVERTEGDTTPGRRRFRLHGLLRRHAERRSRLHGAAGEAAEARTRLIHWYRRQAERADRLADATRLRVAEPAPPLDGAPDVEFVDRHDAKHWVHHERHALYGVVRLAFTLGRFEDCWALCEPLWPHYKDHRNGTVAEEAFRSGVEAAARDEQVRGLARMRCLLSQVLADAARTEEAESVLAPALTATAALAARAGASPDDRKLAASAREFRGNMLVSRGDGAQAAGQTEEARRDWAEAATCFVAAQRIHEEIGNAYGVLLQTHLRGKAAARLGRLAEAGDLFARAHRLAEEQGRDRMTGRTAQELAGVHRALGRTAEAVEYYTVALGIAGVRGATFEQVRIHTSLANLAADAGDQRSADRHRAAARELREQAGHPEHS